MRENENAKYKIIYLLHLLTIRYMFLNLVSLLIGFLCLFVLFLMLLNTKSNRKTNVYFLIILFVVGLQRFLNGIEVLGVNSITYNPLKFKMSLAFFIIPIYYLFFRRLIREETKRTSELLHFTVPMILVFIDIFIDTIVIHYILYLIFSVSYFFAVLVLIKELVNKNSVSLFENNSYKTIKTWAFLMVAITFLLVIYSNYFLFSEVNPNENLNDFYRFSSLLWVILLVHLFRNPVIIFGEQNLLKKIRENTTQEVLLWNAKPLRAIDDKDRKVFDAVFPKINSIIIDIQLLQKNVEVISKVTLTNKIMAQELKIPKNHLDIIFKYYCSYSVNDFSNLIKINYALSLIKNGYLKKHTIASLGEECLFKSRYTFSQNFKKFVGVSVSEYIATVR